MREVRACDFCGESATGVYEPLPESVGAGPRLLLCADCRETLSTVVDPLLDRLDADASAADVITEAEPGGDAAGDPGGATRASGTDAADPGGATRATEGPTESTASTESAGEAGESGGVADEAGGPGGTSPANEAGGRPPSRREGTPRGYRKVMRFLENREFPMERAEAERLASDAYGLDEETVGAAIDHAVKYDRLREISGELRR